MMWRGRLDIVVPFHVIETFYLELLEDTQFRCLDVHTQRWWVVEVKEEFMCFLHPLTADYNLEARAVAFANVVDGGAVGVLPSGLPKDTLR